MEKNKYLEKLLKLKGQRKVDKKWVQLLFIMLSDKLLFNEQKHQYITKEKIKLDSVTNFIKWDSKPFNAYEISEKVSKLPNSKYFGIEPETIRNNWFKNTQRASRKHKQFEDWLNGVIDYIPHESKLIENNITNKNYLSEVRVFDEVYKLAGTIDLLKFNIEELNEYIYIDLEISDIKTFVDITPDRITSFSRQIITYCLLLHARLNEYKKIFEDNLIFINVKIGNVLLLKPINDLTKDVDIMDMDNYEEPQFLNVDKSEFTNIKKELKKRKKKDL